METLKLLLLIIEKSSWSVSEPIDLSDFYFFALLRLGTRPTDVDFWIMFEIIEL